MSRVSGYESTEVRYVFIALIIYSVPVVFGSYIPKHLMLAPFPTWTNGTRSTWEGDDCDMFFFQLHCNWWGSSLPVMFSYKDMMVTTVQKTCTDNLKEVRSAVWNTLLPSCYMASVKINFGAGYPWIGLLRQVTTGPRPDASAPSSSLLTGSNLILKWISISVGKTEESGFFHNLVLYIAMPRNNNWMA